MTQFLTMCLTRFKAEHIKTKLKILHVSILKIVKISSTKGMKSVISISGKL